MTAANEKSPALHESSNDDVFYDSWSSSSEDDGRIMVDYRRMPTPTGLKVVVSGATLGRHCSLRVK